MPRVYVAANSGARIGFANDVKNKLNIVWNDDKRPEDGFKALNVDCDTPDDPVLQQIEYTIKKNKYCIDAVNDIGVENLVGSGLIAGETSAAYNEVPTYCLVTGKRIIINNNHFLGRAVGIGAYAARLSHRIVQVASASIILTGAPALNSVLGREIYTSNSQLGGPQIMYTNGVSHSVVQNDLDGISTIVKWISYLPEITDIQTPSTLATTEIQGDFAMETDDGPRDVETRPTKSSYDPREILDSTNNNSESIGLFDQNSFDEIMSGWAKTIIAGRARLRGLPVGVVSVETRTVECNIPADPADQLSQARSVVQAGQVWYSDSAYKTAEAINDFNREGLPLIVLANIRGFSEMFEMVLKFGACIVDALQAYTQPIIVYIPPFGELRGGAWAVLDTKINPTCITMLADPECRGGVLEATGITEIKFREKDLYVLMGKSDERLKRLEQQLANDKTGEKEIKDKITIDIAKRREFLTPIVKTAADEVAWRNARNYIYELFTVEMAKMSMARRYLKASGIISSLSTIRIDELTKGYKWVTQHLIDAGIQTYHKICPEERNFDKHSKRTRYEYTHETIVRYATSSQFHNVLVQVELERSKNEFINKLKNDDQTMESVIEELLARSTKTVRDKISNRLRTQTERSTSNK